MCGGAGRRLNVYTPRGFNSVDPHSCVFVFACVCVCVCMCVYVCVYFLVGFCVLCSPTFLCSHYPVFPQL